MAAVGDGTEDGHEAAQQPERGPVRPEHEAAHQPPRDVEREPGKRPERQVAVEPEPVAAPRRWSVGARLLAASAVVVLILGAVAVAVIIADPHRLGQASTGAPDGDRPDGTGPNGTGPDGVRPDGSGAARAAEQTMTAPLAGRQRATFVLVDGVSSFDLRVADLGDDLYRIDTPAGAGVVARPEVRGETVRLGLADTGASGVKAVRVLLNERVAWRLQLTGGVSGQVLDLTRARLLGVELAGGSSRTEVLLPAIDGTVVVRLSGGTSQLDVRVPGSPPVRVRVGAGAGSVVVGDERWNGVGAGSLLGAPGWDRSTDRLYLDLVAGANSVTVDTDAG
ncbi:hypothetical protein ABZS77_16005 [Micromonospora sp. NPDC005298]|uniref:hypothetical protein n=1 Tax=Micromonospora sp. NPDC005298 TaxID=3156873 RepID=UPI0033A72F38